MWYNCITGVSPSSFIWFFSPECISTSYLRHWSSSDWDSIPGLLNCILCFMYFELLQCSVSRIVWSEIRHKHPSCPKFSNWQLFGVLRDAESQTLPIIYGVLTKHAVKMAGHWPRYFFWMFMDKIRWDGWDGVEVQRHAKKNPWPISSHLDQISFVNKGLIIWLQGFFFFFFHVGESM